MHVVITGASSGIGEALAREYLKRGASVTLVARRKALLEAIAEDHPGLCHVVEADLADYANADAWVEGAIAALGPIDVLVNNAGVQIVRSTVETTWDEAERQIRLNTLAPFKLTKRVLPDMIARGRGTIVDVSSSAALAPTPGMFFYSASKAAIGAASESLRGELRKTGVHVVTVYPGPVRTAMEASGRAAYEETWAMRTFTPTGDAAVLGRKIADAVASRRARIIYPALYALTRHFPNLTRFVMDRFTPPLKALPKGGGA
ncbi:MAG TPA: SDR family NAD(P)-dependent oxidoreductase [Polyangiaceae bacterium]